MSDRQARTVELDTPDAGPPSPMDFWSNRRVRLYSRGVAAALAFAFVFVALGGGTGRLGGDLPAFYGAGRILLDGDGSQLYAHERQLEAQRGLLPQERANAYLYFPYPPFVAVPYALLARLPFRVAWVVHVLLMGACLVGAVRLAARSLKLPSDAAMPLFVGAITFYPLFKAISGGQNTALSLLFVTAALALQDDRREFLAGVVLGGLWFKPQLAVPLVGLCLIEGRFKTVVGSCATAVALYLVAAVVIDPAWPVAWVHGIASFGGRDQAVNAANAVGFLGVLEAMRGVGDPFALTLGLGLASATAGVLALEAYRGSLANRWERGAAACAGCVLLSPHAVFYDAGLGALALLVGFVRGGTRLRAVVVCLWALSWLHTVAGVGGVTPIFGVLVGTFALALALVHRPPAALGSRTAAQATAEASA